MFQMKILITTNLDDVLLKQIQLAFPTIEVVKAIDVKDIQHEIRDTDVVLAGIFSKELFVQAQQLKWVQSTGAGVERFLFPEFVASPVTLTNASGIHPKQISEHVMGMILAFTRRLNFSVRFQLQKRWERLPVDELSEKILGVVGLGTIGAEIARKAKCFDMIVIATKRSPVVKPAYVDELLPYTSLGELLECSDFVVLSVPLTPETHHLIGEKELRMMKKTSILINIGRGKLIDERVLIKALQERWIAGAGLDVFETEPLPSSSELWSFENVILTPHNAGSSPHYSQRVCHLFIENLTRFRGGRPLKNLVDKKAGY
jgi:phosphoglycerate dehydrogenase-like enzyme